MNEIKTTWNIITLLNSKDLNIQAYEKTEFNNK